MQSSSPHLKPGLCFPLLLKHKGAASNILYDVTTMLAVGLCSIASHTSKILWLGTGDTRWRSWLGDLVGSYRHYTGSINQVGLTTKWVKDSCTETTLGKDACFRRPDWKSMHIWIILYCNIATEIVRSMEGLHLHEVYELLATAPWLRYNQGFSNNSTHAYPGWQSGRTYLGPTAGVSIWICQFAPIYCRQLLFIDVLE